MHGFRNSHAQWFWFTNYIIFIKSVKSDIHMVAFESLTTNSISRTKSLKKKSIHKSAVIHLLNTNWLPSATALMAGWWQLHPVKSIKCTCPSVEFGGRVNFSGYTHLHLWQMLIQHQCADGTKPLWLCSHWGWCRSPHCRIHHSLLLANPSPQIAEQGERREKNVSMV